MSRESLIESLKNSPEYGPCRNALRDLYAARGSFEKKEGPLFYEASILYAKLTKPYAAISLSESIWKYLDLNVEIKSEYSLRVLARVGEMLIHAEELFSQEADQNHVKKRLHLFSKSQLDAIAECKREDVQDQTLRNQVDGKNEKELPSSRSCRELEQDFADAIKAAEKRESAVKAKMVAQEGANQRKESNGNAASRANDATYRGAGGATIATPSANKNAEANEDTSETHSYASEKSEPDKNTTTHSQGCGDDHKDDERGDFDGSEGESPARDDVKERRAVAIAAELDAIATPIIDLFKQVADGMMALIESKTSYEDIFNRLSNEHLSKIVGNYHVIQQYAESVQKLGGKASVVLRGRLAAATGTTFTGMPARLQ